MIRMLSDPLDSINCDDGRPGRKAPDMPECLDSGASRLPPALPTILAALSVSEMSLGRCQSYVRWWRSGMSPSPTLAAARKASARTA